MASPFAFRNFRWLLTGSLCSYLSQWIQQATLGWVVYDITGSGALLGAVLAARAVPMLLLSPMAGVAADRFEHKTLLLVSQVCTALVSVLFGALLALGAVQTWHLYAFVLVSGVTGVLDRPARMTGLFELVPRELAMNAASINSIGMSLTRIVGPAFAGFFMVWFDAAGSFLLQGALYLASGLLVYRVAFPKRARPAHQSSAWKDLADGLRFAAGDSTTRLMLGFAAMLFILLLPIWSAVLPVLAKDVFGAGPQGLGLLLTAGGVGGTLGSFAASSMQRFDRQGRVQFVALLIDCVALFGLALSPSLPVAMGFLVIAGAAEMVIATSTQIMLQMAAPEAMRGRVTSLLQLAPAMISLGALSTGILVELCGARGATAALAAVTAAVFIVLYAKSPRLRNLRLSECRQQYAQGSPGEPHRQQRR
jgi:MFS family permease